MSIFRNFSGTVKSLFHIGGPNGNALKNVSDGVSVRNSADSALQNLTIKAASGASNDHAVSWMDLRDASPLISFSFDGASAPAPADNTGTYGICHTTGGAYSAGQLYFDTGTAIRAIKIPAGTTVTTSSAVDGDVSLIANGIYCAHSATAPYTWTLKGDGLSSGTGLSKLLEIALGTSASYTSTSGIPSGAEILWAKLRIDTPYSAGTTGGAVLDGTVSDLTVVSDTDVDMTKAATYLLDVEDGAVTADTEGSIKFTIAGGPGAGAGVLLVSFAPTTLV